MATLATADLPSDEEEDEDYNPERDPDKGDPAQTSTSGVILKQTKRRRGGAFAPDIDAGAGTGVVEDAPGPREPQMNSREAAKKAKVDAIWSQLKGLSRTPLQQGGTAKPAAPFSLAALCRPVADRTKTAGGNKVGPYRETAVGLTIEFWVEFTYVTCPHTGLDGAAGSQTAAVSHGWRGDVRREFLYGA